MNAFSQFTQRSVLLAELLLQFDGRGDVELLPEPGDVFLECLLQVLVQFLELLRRDGSFQRQNQHLAVDMVLQIPLDQLQASLLEGVGRHLLPGECQLLAVAFQNFRSEDRHSIDGGNHLGARKIARGGFRGSHGNRHHAVTARFTVDGIHRRIDKSRSRNR